INGYLVFDICQPQELKITSDIMKRFVPDPDQNTDEIITAFETCLNDEVIPFMLQRITSERIKKIQDITDMYLKNSELTISHGPFLNLLKSELDGKNPETVAVQVLWNACVAEIRSIAINDKSIAI
ncbi:hypothetical protein K8T06_11815, partial [bacterium]|nr:hypothetical protein [bacterium]